MAELGAELARNLQTLAAASVPLPALAKLQGEYLQQASRRCGTRPSRSRSAAVAAPIAASPAQDWAANPTAAYMAQMYLLNARTLMQLADSVEADAKTRQRIRFGVQQWVDMAVAEQLPRAQPRGAAPGARDQGREHRAGPAPPVA